jgi:hypothetical protein
MTTTTTNPTSTDTGFLRSLLWATVTIAGATMMLAVLWTRAS